MARPGCGFEGGRQLMRSAIPVTCIKDTCVYVTSLMTLPLVTWLGSDFPGVSSLKLLFLPSILCLQKSLCKALMEGVDCFPTLYEVSTEIIGILWREICLFSSHWLTYSIICLYHYGLLGTYFSLWVIIQSYFIYFVIKRSSFDHWELFQLALCPFTKWNWLFSY